MNELLFERSAGSLGPNALARGLYTQLMHAFRPAPRLRFDGGELGANIETEDGSRSSVAAPLSSHSSSGRDLWAHQAGVNALALERFDGRILLSGGSDATIRIWDLEQANQADPSDHTFRPVAEIIRAGASGPAATGPFRRQQQPQAVTHAQTGTASHGHRFGVTHLSFYPFDAAAFLSSSFDQTLKLWATDSARLSGSFDLGSKVYSHAISPVADHLLVACATQHPAVRLVDLRSGAAVQSLVAPGQVAGAVLSVAWSPRCEHVLASGAVDGTVRIWDVRRASGLVSLLDQEDSLGLAYRENGEPRRQPFRASAKAHSGPVNGLTWTSDGSHLVSAGHDRRIRVWDMATGANTLVSFGPSVRNSGLSSIPMFVSPTGATPPRQELLFWPNESEILVFRLHDGSIVTRLRGVGPSQFAVRMADNAPPPPRPLMSRPPPSNPRPAAVVDRSSSRRNRVSSLVWRGAGGLGSETGGAVMGGRDAVGGLYSGHLDGQIRAWVPQVAATGEEDEDELLDDDADEAPHAVEERDRKRRALDQAYRSLMGTQITFR